MKKIVLVVAVLLFCLGSYAQVRVEVNRPGVHVRVGQHPRSPYWMMHHGHRMHHGHWGYNNHRDHGYHRMYRHDGGFRNNHTNRGEGHHHR